MKHIAYSKLSPEQCDIIRTMAGKFNYTKIAMAANTSNYFVKALFKKEKLPVYRVEPKKPKRVGVFERLYIPDPPKVPFVRPKAEYSNVKSLYNLDQ